MLSDWIPTASFRIGGVTLYWYAMMVTLAILVGYIVLMLRAKSQDIKTSHLENLFLVIVPSALVGARLYHVMLNLSYYLASPLEVFNLRAGGLAIHGAIILGASAAYLYARYAKLNYLKLLDLMVPSLAIGQAIGRFGNFFNQELYGRPTDLPWKLYIDPMHRLPEYYADPFYHPTFLYESLLNLSLAALLLFLAHKVKVLRTGTIVALYLIGYGLIRFSTEFVRIDESAVLGPFKFAQLASLLLILGGLGMLYFLGRKPVTDKTTQPAEIKTTQPARKPKATSRTGRR